MKRNDVLHNHVLVLGRKTIILCCAPSLCVVVAVFARIKASLSFRFLPCGSNEMPVPVQGGYQRGPSCWDRVKMGFTIGFCVGMASGALFGGFSALRYGLRGRELIQSVGKVMLQGGGTFGTFMSIGTAIRC